MDAYVYQAELLCEDCAMKHLAPHDYDSNEDLPQGPYADGGGEWDSPQHCAECGVFLENPLTYDGEDYLTDALDAWYDEQRGDPGVLLVWARYYGMHYDERLLTGVMRSCWVRRTWQCVLRVGRKFVGRVLNCTREDRTDGTGEM